MRTLPEGLAAALAGGVTTLCRCWRIARRDGLVQGFTDHDETVTFDGVAHLPAGGLTASADVAGNAMAAGGLEVEGALSADGFSEADLAGGRYDGAEVDVFVVDWSAPENHVRVRRGVVGEVTRADGAFRAEVRGHAQELDAPRGRLFQAGCDANLGDGRCRADVAGPAFLATAVVAAAESATVVRVEGLAGYEPGWFAHGRLVAETGANAGWASEVKAHARDGAGGPVRLEIWRTPPSGFSAGDAVRVTAGCDKRFATCRRKFDNAANFQGFPHLPGDAFALSYPPHPSGENDRGVIV